MHGTKPQVHEGAVFSSIAERRGGKHEGHDRDKNRERDQADDEDTVLEPKRRGQVRIRDLVIGLPNRPAHDCDGNSDQAEAYDASAREQLSKDHVVGDGDGARRSDGCGHRAPTR